MLVSVGQQNGHPEATFGSLYGVDSLTVLIATKPDRGSDGNFLQENTLWGHVGSLTDDEIASRSWRSESQLDPGLYYVMAHSWNHDCWTIWDRNCSGGFFNTSDVLTLTVPKPAQKQKYRTSVEVPRFLGAGYLNISVWPLGVGVKLPYRVCWTLTRGSRCLRSTVSGHSWYSPASHFLQVPLRKMRKLTTFTWYVDGRVVSVKRVRISR
jgi:hypothetical protein